MSRKAGSERSGSGIDLPLGFARQLIDWQLRHGRHGLPWQNTRDPYRVWLSEVMLQQTQVSSVRTYYPRFLARFPDVQTLAAATPDEVMALWSGLGYYSRARNLHRCAQTVVAEHQGTFPSSAQALQALPGIGASTAAAIAAFCHGERVSILDGNVRRVLSRLLAFEGDLAQVFGQRELMSLARALLPETPTHDDMTAYTQGLMDLGSGVCTRSRPGCLTCPVQELCQAHAQGQVQRFPIQTRKLKRRHETWWLLLMHDSTPARTPRVWLERRPPRGIWAGLHCLPVFDSQASLHAVLPTRAPARLVALEPMMHNLTHRELRLQPMRLEADAALRKHLSDSGPNAGRWISMDELDRYGLPAPVRQLLASTTDQR